jgi:hypothetical protein
MCTEKYPRTQNLHCPQCVDKENTNVVQRGVKKITKTSRRRHGAGGAEGPKAGGSLSKMARSISRSRACPGVQSSINLQSEIACPLRCPGSVQNLRL